MGLKGANGWAINFLTVGVTTAEAAPESSTMLGLLAAGVCGLGWRKRAQ